MKINWMGINHTHCENFVINRPAGSGDYLLLLINSSTIFKLQGKEIIAEKNTMIIYNKGTPQYYGANHSKFCNDFIHFDTDVVSEINNLPLDTLLTLPSTVQINKLLLDIYMEFISTNMDREKSMNLLLRLLFVKINEVAVHKPKNTVLYSYYDALLNLRSLIYRHPEEKWTIARLSGQVNLSPSHFQRLYKNTFGVTCIADVIACKMDYAKASLTGSGGSVREISVLCGYDNEEHFMRQFKQVLGVTPSQYRRQTMDQ